mmetsp:Transcript_4472/g.13122  ORF Transcript_4472/g.13122 Transcript_4472/m.13122 type:complete len:235 (+) Transcript_4472:548-1252(+)
MTLRVPSRMPVVESMARRTGDAPRRTTPWAQTSSSSPESSTTMATSAESASPSTFSHVSMTPSETARLLARQCELDRISIALSIASRSSFQSAASVILIARSAARRHWKADLPAKTMLFVSFRCPLFSKNQNFCTSQEEGAAASGSAPFSMARRSSTSLACFSTTSSPMRSPKPSPLAALSSDSVPVSSLSLPKSTACRVEPKSGWRPHQSKLLVSTPFRGFSFPIAKASQIHC